MKIPLTKPHIPANLLSGLEAVLRTGVLHGNGEVGQRVERWMQQRYGFRHVLLTTSGTHALELAMMLLDAKSGDEAILPSFTFVSTANAVLRRGLVPVFAEIDKETLNISPEDVAKRVTPKTRVIIPVHYAGVACDMDALRSIADEHKLAIVEDAAHAIGASYKGRMLGGIGAMGCLSFHDTKNVTCGEGGAFITNDDRLAARAETIREKGTNRAQFLRGEVDKYTWVDIGSSFVISEILAALLEAQFAVIEEITKRRKTIYEFYLTNLRPLEQRGLLRLPVIPPYAQTNYHLFHILLPTEGIRNALMVHLRNAGIAAAFHYIPLHSSPFGKQFARGELPVTERVSQCLLRLPLYPDLTEAECSYIVEQITKFFLKMSGRIRSSFP
ncbi:MAG: dTDP-4-amino-4,6-dideoxygalactose transaminase [Bacteroidota bacterium]